MLAPVAHGFAIDAQEPSGRPTAAIRFPLHQQLPQLHRVQGFEHAEERRLVRNVVAPGVGIAPAAQPSPLPLIEPLGELFQVRIAAGDSAHQSQQHEAEDGGLLVPQSFRAARLRQARSVRNLELAEGE